MLGFVDKRDSQINWCLIQNRISSPDATLNQSRTESHRHPAKSGRRREQRKEPARSAANTRKPASVGSGSFPVRSSRQGAVRLEFIRRGIGSGRHPSSRSGRGHICGLCPALQRELNELWFAKHPETSPCIRKKIERPPESTLHAKSVAASSQSRRTAPARCRTWLV